MAKILVTVENLTKAGGIFLTPIWVGFHNGSFDYFDIGSKASGELERIAEDGDSSFLSSSFQSQNPNGTDGLILGAESGAAGPFDPGERASMEFEIDENMNKYFSYSAMVIPSNDAFIGNDSGKFLQLFDKYGNFNGAQEFTVYGSNIYDAGTEKNTEMDAAFINQTAPNTGVTTDDAISVHPGFIGSLGNPLPGEDPIILGGQTAAGTTVTKEAGDFTQPGYQLVKFTITLADDLVLHGDRGDNKLVGYAGDDKIFGYRGDDTLIGNQGDDSLYGGRGDDYLNGGMGNDELYGGRGDDVLVGYMGYDKLYGGRGDDKLYGGMGDDKLAGGRGDDYLNGGMDNDKLYGGRGDDKLYGGMGDDKLAGGRGDDYLNGGMDNDKLYGGRGDDYLKGDMGYDKLYGGRGADKLYGGMGDDKLVGGRGDDEIHGGKGADMLYGGRGADSFNYSYINESTTSYYDMIKDFKSGHDVIDFSKLNSEIINEFSDLTIGHSSNYTTINADGTDLEIRLSGVIDLDEVDFMFS